jgi:hypothetical protein
MRNTENTTSLYWFGPLESKTQHPVVDVDCLRIVYWYKGQWMRSVPRLLVGYDLET